MNTLLPHRSLVRQSILLVLAWTCSAALLAQTTSARPPDTAVASKNAGAQAPAAFSELVAKATAGDQGRHVGITATADGAELRAAFQKLAGTVTREGLRLDSTDDAGGSLRLRSSAVGRGDGRVQALPAVGRVACSDALVTFTRPGVTEEYTVSVDGVRQDFLIAQKPAGGGALRLELALQGAHASADAAGVKLVLDESGRALVYNRLHVTDARGSKLAAHFEVAAADRILVHVDDANAVYPVRIDPTFSDADWMSMSTSVPGAQGDVRAVAAYGTDIYIGGSFTFVGGVSAAYVAKWNGTTWSALGSGVNGPVYAMHFDGSQLYIGGAFTQASGVANTTYIAQWNGSAWQALGTGANGAVNALVKNGSNLYAGGSFTLAGGVAGTSRIAKWDGTAWSALGSGMDGTVNALAKNGPSNIYAGGDFTTAGGTLANRVAKWDGTSWSALGTGITGGSVLALGASDFGSDIYVGGSFTNAGGGFVSNLAKWNGTTWSAVGTGVDGPVNCIAMEFSDAYVGGLFSSAGGVANTSRVARWNGSSWLALGTGLTPATTSAFPVSAMAKYGSTLVIGGIFTEVGTVAASNVAVWDGSAWSAKGTGTGAINSVVADGTDIYAGGSFTQIGGVSASRVAKWNGSDWTPLGTGMNSAVHVLLRSGTSLYAGGTFTTAGGASANRIAMWDGTSWSALGTGMNGTVTALTKSGANVFAGGLFTTAGGVSASNIAQWNGTTWSAMGTGANGQVNALALLGTDIIAGGSFSTMGGVSANCLARWNGSAWSVLGGSITGIGSTVNALLASGSNLYIGGQFSAANAVSVSNIAKWNGTVWSALGTGVNGPVNALAESAGQIYAGGSFVLAGGSLSLRLARWNGTAWSAGGSGMDGPVQALAADTASHLYVAGAFSFAGSSTLSPQIARSSLEGALSFNANLSALAVSTGTLSPAFAAGTKNYLVTVSSATSSVTVTPTKSFANATIEVRVNGGTFASATSGVPTSALALNVGENIIDVRVTAEDGLMRKTYSLYVIRAAPAQTTAILDDFDNGALGTNPNGTGTGFDDNGQTAVTESGGFVNMNTTSGVSTMVIASKNNLNPFTSTATTAAFRFGAVNYDASWHRLCVGWRLASSSHNHFYPYGASTVSAQGLYVILYAQNNEETAKGNLYAVDGAGVYTRIASWNWSSNTQLSNLIVTLTTTASTYQLGFSGASATPTFVTGTASGLLTGLGTLGANFEVGVHNQVGSSAAGAVFVDRITVTTDSLTAPEIAVKGPTIVINDGDTTPSTADSTDFGSTSVNGGTVLKNFVVENTGNATLNLTGTPLVTITGANAADFTVTQPPVASIPAAQVSGLGITFDPSAAGLRTATVTIANNDSDENPYDFTIQGTGTIPAPTVTGIVPSGGSTAGGTSVTITGTDFTGATAVTIGGAAATSVNVVNATTITCTTPAHAAGTASVLVTTPGGTNAANTLFTYALPPTITSPTSTSVTGTTATLGGNVTNDGGGAITQRGVVYSATTTNGNPQLGGSGVSSATASGTTGIFTVNVTSLAPGTAYSFKAYATNAAGTSYTSTGSFTTPSTNADLSSLSLSSGTLSPVFASGTTSYTAGVPNPVSSITVTPVKADANATVTVNGGSPFTPVSLALGTNTITILVTAQDGTTTKTYTVVVTRTPGVTVMDFESLQIVGSLLYLRGKHYEEDGYQLDTLNNTDLVTPGTLHSGYLGSTSISNASGGGVTRLTKEGGGAFTLNGISLAGRYGAVSGTVVFTGTRADGSTVTQGHTLSGASFTWQAFTFSTFTNVVKVEWTQLASYFQLDQIVLDGAQPVAPEMVVIGQTNVYIADGDSTPSTQKGTDFGGVNMTSGSFTRTFTIRNTGPVALNLTGTPKVVIGGTNPADFTVTAAPVSPVAATTGSTSFQITFDPSASGIRTATVSIDNNDAEENPFNFTIRGVGGTAPTLGAANATNVLATTATLNGDVTSDGGTVIIERGFVYSRTAQSSTPAINGAGVTKVNKTGTTGAFTAALTALQSSTGYSFRAYAINAAGTTYSSVQTFTTTAPIALTVQPANATRPYPQPNPVFTGTLTGVVPGDNITATYSTSATAGSPAGTYPIAASLNDPNGVIGKYTVTILPATLTVTPATTSVPGVSRNVQFSASAQTVQLSANVYSTVTMNTGTVTFQVKNGATNVGTAVTSSTVANSLATVNYDLPAGLPFGNYTIQVTYNGTANFSTSTSSTGVLTVIAPPGIASLAVTGVASPVEAGTVSTLVVTAKNAGGAIYTGYTGTVSFTSTDAAAVLPASYTFTPGDAGVKTFTVTLRTAGTHSITVTDAANVVSGSRTGIVVTARASATPGQLFAFGRNSDGQLGDGTTTWRLSRVPVPGMTNLIAVAAGSSHTLAVKADGSVWAWGANGAGQLGTNTSTGSNVPVQVKGEGGVGFLTGCTAVAAREQFSLALKSDGTVWAWGYNSGGVLGVSSATLDKRLTPAQVPGLSGITAIAAGNSVCLALKADGTVMAWGGSSYGAMGDGFMLSWHFTPAPVQVAGGAPLTGITAIAMGGENISGDFGVALKNDGNVWVWGNARTVDDSRYPKTQAVRLTTFPSDTTTAIAVGGNQILMKQTDGRLNSMVVSNVNQYFGTQGLGTSSLAPAPTAVRTPDGSQFLSGVASFAAGAEHSVARMNDGTVLTWGRGWDGALGTGDTIERLLPTKARDFAACSLVASGAASHSSFAVDALPATTQFIVTAPATVLPGMPFQGTVRAVDAQGNSVAHVGTVQITTNDPLGPPVPYDLFFVAGDNGVKTFPMSLRTAGTLTITARDKSVPSLTGSTTVSVSVPTTTSVTSVSVPTAGAQPVILSASVAATASGAGTLSGGMMTFRVKNGATLIGSEMNVLGAGGMRSVSYYIPAGTAAGTYTIEVTYSGAPGFDASTGTGFLRMAVAGGFADGGKSSGFTSVQLAGASDGGNFSGGTTNALALPSTLYSQTAQTVPLTAVIDFGSGTVNEGSVVFTVVGDGGAFVGSPCVADVAGGVASVDYLLPAGLPIGTYTVLISYSGGATYDGSSAEDQLTVNPAFSIITASAAAANRSDFAQSVSLLANVISSSGAVNEGTVTFQIKDSGGTNIGSAAISPTVSDGFAAVNYTLPAGQAAGTYFIHATYNSGSANITGSLDNTHTLEITGVPESVNIDVADKTATTSASPQNLTLDATLTSAGGIVAAGNVTFQLTLDGVNVGTAVIGAVSNGAASVTYVLPGGSGGGNYTILATYDGTVSFTASAGLGSLVVSNTSNADLSALKLSNAAALTPAFTSNHLTYTSSVPGAITSISVSPLAADPGAAVRVNGTLLASGASSAPITLNTGANVIAVLVTAGNGTTTKTYTLTVTRETIASAVSAYAALFGLTGNDTLPTATPFNDGVPNLLKYAFNMSLSGPNVTTLTPGGGVGGLPVVSLPGSPDTIRVEFIRRRDSGLVYTPLISTDNFATFIPMTATPVVNVISETWERVTIDQPLGPVPPNQAFVRVSVTIP
ncbi:MAG: cadherin-like beta sandwich domain-containing protein [Verrucomicrobiaceae bacterium]|nr:cadherin-like beta sandwich domain-containing protein [Verrucomicrobiaceae bacterium]